jgi:hypothetical protein
MLYHILNRISWHEGPITPLFILHIHPTTVKLPALLQHMLYCHHIITIHYHQLMIFNRWKFLPIKTNYRSHFFCPLFWYSCYLATTAVSVPIIWGADCYSCLVVNICTNWTHSCQLNAETLSVGIKYTILLFELPSYIQPFGLLLFVSVPTDEH